MTEVNNQVVDTCLMAGKILIENGSEISRVDDTMERIANNAGIKDSKRFIMITGIMMSIPDSTNAQVEPILKRSIDLEKIAAVNQLSRQFAEQTINLGEFNAKLRRLDNDIPAFPEWLQIAAAALMSGVLSILFTNEAMDVFASVIAGGIGFVVYFELNKRVSLRFLSEFTGSLVIALMAVFLVHIGLGVRIDSIVIGAVMSLVPGVPITNAVRDTLSGNLISGPARAVEAILSACAIGLGIALVIKMFV